MAKNRRRNQSGSEASSGADAQRAAPRHRGLHHVARLHGRLIVAALIGAAVYGLAVATTAEWRLSTHLLLAWNAAALAYLVMALRVFADFDIAHVRRRASDQDDGAVAILFLTVAAAAASLIAIVVQLGPVMEDDPARPWHFALAVVTIVLSWFFIQTMFAFHYAYEYYGEGRDGIAGGLDFPEDDKPDYWDFVYFSMVLGMTFQVSDVEISSKTIRRLAAAHGLVAFFYNVAILALCVNIGASLIG